VEKKKRRQSVLEYLRLIQIKQTLFTPNYVNFFLTTNFGRSAEISVYKLTNVNFEFLKISKFPALKTKMPIFQPLQ
jgi:hypothetical protein